MYDNGQTEISDTDMGILEPEGLERAEWASFAWTFENYHRGLKQFCLIEMGRDNLTKAALIFGRNG